MIRSILVDDEQIGRDLLADLLRRYCPGISVVAEADSVASAREAIERHEPDLIFLDIRMPRGNGFGLLDGLGQCPFGVIFTTAYEEYAIRAIRASALDYLLKPINRDELVAAVARAEAERGRALERRRSMELLVERLHRTHGEPERLALPSAEGLVIVAVDDLVRCEAEGSYTWCHLAGGTRRLVSRRLKEFEEMLADMNFVRVHHSHLVNVDHIRRYVRGEGGELIMSDESRVMVARRRKDELLRVLGAIGLRQRL